jgi:hypothetical protein
MYAGDCMFYDFVPVSVSLTQPAEEILTAPANEPSILGAIRKTGHSLVIAAKRAGRKPALFSIMMAGAAFGPLQMADAATVTTTITGTVAAGTDVTGVFGFPPNTRLAGQSFKLVFTFDDTKGTQSISDSAGVPCGSAINNTAASNPGTATLQIGTGTWSFGTVANTTQTSFATRIAGKCGSYEGGGSAEYSVADVIGATGVGIGDNLIINIDPATGTVLTTDYNWEDAFSNSQLADLSNSFLIFWGASATGQLYSASGQLTPTSITVSGPNSGSSTPTGLQFIPVTPCRVADTRNATGSFGGPELAAGTSREFDIPQSACSIPSSAVAYSLNVTAVPSGPLGYLTLWPSGQTQPTVSTLNSDGRVKANAAITPAGTNGGVSVFVTNASHVILDIDGYFVPAGTASALAFYPVTPCRVVDTRNANGSLGGPSLAGGSSRDFPVQSSNCALPSDAKAYSLNVTAIPKGPLGYLTMWPSGQTQPLVSTLNSPTGAVAANGAIVPAGSNGDVSVFVSNPSDVVLDVNGYFAAPSANGLSLYTTTPCRVLDTRNSAGAFNGVLGVAVENSSCAPSSTAQAYVLNATVVPSSSLGYLTLWPAGETQPVVSTLNAVDGAVTSNMAIVPTVNGSIDAFSSNPTQLILDLSSYFAP